MVGYGDEEGVIATGKLHGTGRMALPGPVSGTFTRKGKCGQSKRCTEHDCTILKHKQLCLAPHTSGSSVQSRLQSPHLGC